jgi:hypothetical protein
MVSCGISGVGLSGYIFHGVTHFVNTFIVSIISTQL